MGDDDHDRKGRHPGGGHSDRTAVLRGEAPGGAERRATCFDVRVGRFPFVGNGKAIALGEPDGLVKTIFDAKTGELLGAHLIGPDVSEAAAQAPGDHGDTLRGFERSLREGDAQIGFSPELARLMKLYLPRRYATTYERELKIREDVRINSGLWDLASGLLTV